MQRLHDQALVGAACPAVGLAKREAFAGWHSTGTSRRGRRLENAHVLRNQRGAGWRVADRNRRYFGEISRVVACATQPKGRGLEHAHVLRKEWGVGWRVADRDRRVACATQAKGRGLEHACVLRNQRGAGWRVADRNRRVACATQAKGRRLEQSPPPPRLPPPRGLPPSPGLRWTGRRMGRWTGMARMARKGKGGKG